MFNCVKRWDNFPFAHRQPNHAGHCSLIHGHNWAFEFEFRCVTQDENGFVVDFGSLKFIRDVLEAHFDHTLVLNEDDPMLLYLEERLERTYPEKPSLAQIITVPNCGAEGLAHYLYNLFDTQVKHVTMGRAHLHRVTVFEDSRNSATYFANDVA